MLNIIYWLYIGYLVIAGITFVHLCKNGEVEVRRKDGREITQKEKNRVKFAYLTLLSLIWFISVPIVIKERDGEDD